MLQMSDTPISQYQTHTYLIIRLYPNQHIRYVSHRRRFQNIAVNQSKYDDCKRIVQIKVLLLEYGDSSINHEPPYTDPYVRWFMIDTGVTYFSCPPKTEGGVNRRR